tara:strand:- start:3863 stop:4384 length:522 start_codon:yes stop_codon:yes gene_type:complete
MFKLLLILLFPTAVFGADIMICNGEYALCAASGSTPTGKTIMVKGKAFQEGMAVCPVLKGRSVANGALMKNSCDAPPGKVWSLFSTVSEAPQAPSWAVTSLVQRTFVLEKGNGMSNQWSFLCDKQAKPVNGVQLASCYGPINESPLTNGHVKPGAKIITDAPAGVLNPVGGNF